MAVDLSYVAMAKKGRQLNLSKANVSPQRKGWGTVIIGHSGQVFATGK